MKLTQITEAQYTGSSGTISTKFAIYNTKVGKFFQYSESYAGAVVGFRLRDDFNCNVSLYRSVGEAEKQITDTRDNINMLFDDAQARHYGQRKINQLGKAKAMADYFTVVKITINPI